MSRKLGPCSLKRVQVDDVDVGAVARRQHAAVVEADGAGSVTRLTLDHERQARPRFAVSGPVPEQGGRETAIADRADVSTAVQQAPGG